MAASIFGCLVFRINRRALRSLRKNIKKYCAEEDFSIEEKIEHISTLTGIFPFDLVMTKQIKESIQRNHCPPLGKWDPKLGIAWFIPREIIRKKTKNDKPFWVVKVTDDTSSASTIRCWGIREHDEIHINRPYAAKLQYSEDWGFSTRSIRNTFKLLG